MPDESFIQRLRMNNIFPAQGNPDPLIGMPNFYGGRPQEQITQPQPRLQQIAEQVIQPAKAFVPPAYGQVGNEEKHINYEYKAPESDKYATNILMGGTQKDKDLASKEAIASGKNQTALQIANRKQALAEKIAAGKATDAEKQQYAIDLEGERQSGRESLQGMKSDQAYGIQGMRSSDAYGLQDVKGSQALEQIGARIAGQKDIASSKPISPIQPSQVNSQQKNAARELVIKQPELAKFVKIEPNGNFTVDPNTPLNELSMIQNAIYSKNNKDINLPSGSKPKIEAKAENKAKPSAAELLKKYGG